MKTTQAAHNYAAESFSRESIEAETALRFLARANPPPILFRYRPPTSWALEEISKQQIYAAKSEELNDPFECSAPVVWNIDIIRRHFIEEFAPTRGLSAHDAAKEFDSSSEQGMARMLDALKRTISQTGIVCLSARPNSIRMWSYYAQAHEGICVGYDTKVRPFGAALEVKYQNPDAPFDIFASLIKDSTEIACHITLRKAEEWKFEEEYRIPIGLRDGPRLIPFPPSAVQEIRLGARIKAEFKARVLEAISHLPHRPKLLQMGCDFERFILTETVL